MSKEQSVLLNIAPAPNSEIEEKLTTKNAVSSVLNRIKSLEQDANALAKETKFLREMLEEFLDE